MFILIIKSNINNFLPKQVSGKQARKPGIDFFYQTKLQTKLDYPTTTKLPEQSEEFDRNYKIE